MKYNEVELDIQRQGREAAARYIKRIESGEIEINSKWIVFPVIINGVIDRLYYNSEMNKFTHVESTFIKPADQIKGTVMETISPDTIMCDYEDMETRIIMLEDEEE